MTPPDYREWTIDIRTPRCFRTHYQDNIKLRIETLVLGQYYIPDNSQSSRHTFENATSLNIDKICWGPVLTSCCVACIGKSTLLDALGNREVPIPPNMDIFHLTEEVAASDMTPLQCVMEVDEER